MKARWLFTILTFMQLTIASASQLVKAKWLPATQQIELTVRHGGGCAKHKWGIAFDTVCAESFPAQCSAKLIHLEGQQDMCEAIVTTSSKVKWTSHPYDQYYLAISDGAKAKSILISAKKIKAPVTVTCKVIDKKGKSVKIRPGQSRPAEDSCNTCTCMDTGYMACTEIACAPKNVCKSGGKTYQVGQSFPSTDGCNSCTCYDGGAAACTELFCGNN